MITMLTAVCKIPPLDLVAIMPIGASSIVGQVATGTENAWRLDVNNLIVADGVGAISWIGPKMSGDAPSNHHDGVGGTTCEDHIVGAGGATAVSLLIGPGYLYQPDVIVLMIGGNDSVATWESETIGLKPLARAIQATKPNLYFVIVTVTRERAAVPTQQNTWLLGTGIPALQAEGLRIEPCDTYSVMADTPSFFELDGHMSLTGYAEAATILHEPIRRQVVRAYGGTP